LESFSTDSEKTAGWIANLVKRCRNRHHGLTEFVSNMVDESSLQRQQWHRKHKTERQTSVAPTQRSAHHSDSSAFREK